MASPGRVVTKNGKAVYEPLMYDDDRDAGPQESYGVKNFPNESKVWPEYDASFINRLFFWWFNPLVAYGQHVALEMPHIWHLHAKESATTRYPQFHALWRDECARIDRKMDGKTVSNDEAEFGVNKPGLFRPIIRYSIRMILESGLILIVAVLMQFARPLLMQQILLVVEGSPEAKVSTENAWLLAVAIAVASLVDFLSNAHYNMMTIKGMLRLRQGLVGLLFHKVTKLSPGTKASYSQGKITNMMSTDADRVRQCVRVVNNIWTIPLRFFIALYLIVDILGARAATSGLFVMILLIREMTMLSRFVAFRLATEIWEYHCFSRHAHVHPQAPPLPALHHALHRRPRQEDARGHVRHPHHQADELGGLLRRPDREDPQRGAEAGAQVRGLPRALLHHRHVRADHHHHHDAGGLHARRRQHAHRQHRLPGADAAGHAARAAARVPTAAHDGRRRGPGEP